MKKTFQTKQEACDFLNKKLWEENETDTIQIDKPEYNNKTNKWEVYWEVYKIK